MPPLLHLSPPTKEGPSGPLWIPPRVCARPFGRRAKSRLVRSDFAARYRGVSGARAAMSERTSRLCGEIQTGGLSPPLVVAEGWGFQGGRGPIRKGPFPPWRAFAFFSHEGKEGRSRRSETPALVAPAGAKSLLDKSAQSCIMKI